MKKHILFYPIILGLCVVAFYSCGKDSSTVVNGTVVDKYTRMPIPNAMIEFQITHKPDADGSDNIETRYVYSDKEGNFIFENSLPIRIFTIRKAGYLIKGQVAVINGEVNDLTIEMIPEDGLLNLKVENASGIHDTIFLAIFSPILKSEIDISGGKISLPNPISILTIGQSFSQNIPLASNQDVTIYWDYKPVVYSTSFQASAYILKNDTVFYTISY